MQYFHTLLSRKQASRRHESRRHFCCGCGGSALLPRESPTQLCASATLTQLPHCARSTCSHAGSLWCSRRSYAREPSQGQQPPIQPPPQPTTRAQPPLRRHQQGPTHAHAGTGENLRGCAGGANLRPRGPVCAGHLPAAAPPPARCPADSPSCAPHARRARPLRRGKVRGGGGGCGHHHAP